MDSLAQFQGNSWQMRRKGLAEKALEFLFLIFSLRVRRGKCMIWPC